MIEAKSRRLLLAIVLCSIWSSLYAPPVLCSVSPNPSSQLDNLTLFSDKAKQKYAERLYNRKDSFFHLQNNIAKKDMEKKQLRATYYGQVARERQREASRMSQEEMWKKEIEQDPDNDFLKIMMKNNYGVSK